jgi:hypothetical protein
MRLLVRLLYQKDHPRIEFSWYCRRKSLGWPGTTAVRTTGLDQNGAPEKKLVENYVRLYQIDAFNVIPTRPAPGILLGPCQTTRPFGTAIGFASDETILRQAATNMDHHAMRVEGVARSRVHVPAAVCRLKFGHMPEMTAHDGDLEADQTGAFGRLSRANSAFTLACVEARVSHVVRFLHEHLGDRGACRYNSRPRRAITRLTWIGSTYDI